LSWHFAENKNSWSVYPAGSGMKNSAILTVDWDLLANMQLLRAARKPQGKSGSASIGIKVCNANRPEEQA